MNESERRSVWELDAAERQARTEAVLTAARVLRERKVLGPMSTAEASLVLDVPEVLRVAKWIVSGVDVGHDEDEALPEVYSLIDQRTVDDLTEGDRIAITFEICVSDASRPDGEDVNVTGRVTSGPNATKWIALQVPDSFIVDVLSLAADGGCGA